MQPTPPQLIRETFPIGPLQCNCKAWRHAGALKYSL